MIRRGLLEQLAAAVTSHSGEQGPFSGYFLVTIDPDGGVRLSADASEADPYACDLITAMLAAVDGAAPAEAEADEIGPCLGAA